MGTKTNHLEAVRKKILGGKLDPAFDYAIALHPAQLHELLEELKSDDVGTAPIGDKPNWPSAEITIDGIEIVPGPTNEFGELRLLRRRKP